MNDKIIFMQITNDQNILAEVGKVALLHEHLNHSLKMMLKSLSNVSVKEAVDATKYDGAKALRDRVKKLARQKLGEGTALIKLQALLERCGRATEKRNELIHNIWGYELDGDFLIQTNEHDWKQIPTLTQLNELAVELEKLTNELIMARLDGFLVEPLSKIHSES